jgi:phage anti-repressor protein
MKELIKITEQDGIKAVSARELHGFLGSKQRFADWIKNRINQYGLVENEDFVRFHKSMKSNESLQRGGDKRSIEYALSIDCAKELSMVEGNEKGKQARRYFIERDKELRAVERETAKIVNSMDERLRKLEAKATQEPLGNDFTVFGYSSLTRKKLYGSEAMTIGKRAAKRCREEREEIGRVHDPRYGMVNVYPEWVLRDVFEEYFKNPRF